MKSPRRVAVATIALFMALSFGAVEAPSVSGGAPLAFTKSATADDDDGGEGRGGGVGPGSARGGDGRQSAPRAGSPFKLFKGIFAKPKSQPRKQRRKSRRTQTEAELSAPQTPRQELVALGLTQADLDRLGLAGYAVLERHRLQAAGVDIARLRVPTRLTIEQARDEVQVSAPQATIDLNHLYTPESRNECKGADCLARDLIGWSPDMAGAPGCSQNIRIGMIDTAINEKHATLAGSRIEVKSFSSGNVAGQSGKQHGTAVAALLVGSPDGRAPGLLPGAQLIAVDAFARSGRGDDVADAFTLARALDYLDISDVSVINLSLSGPANTVLARSVKTTADSGIVLVAAAGNGGPQAKPVYPAAYAEVIAVTAVDRLKRAYRRAGRGDHIDIAAPGVEVWTAASIQGSRPKSGTSFAAPFVTAAIALATNDDGVAGKVVLERLTARAEDLGEPGKDDVFGWGLLNAKGLCAAANVAAP